MVLNGCIGSLRDLTKDGNQKELWISREYITFEWVLKIIKFLSTKTYTFTCKHRQSMANSRIELKLLGIYFKLQGWCWVNSQNWHFGYRLTCTLNFTFAIKANTIADLKRKICMNVLRVVKKLLPPFLLVFFE